MTLEVPLEMANITVQSYWKKYKNTIFEANILTDDDKWMYLNDGKHKREKGISQKPINTY